MASPMRRSPGRKLPLPIEFPKQRSLAVGFNCNQLVLNGRDGQI